MYLVGTNVWLERLLDQARSIEVAQFLDHILSERLVITDFSFHSIGVVLTKLGKAEALLQFVQDAFVEGAVALVRLAPEDSRALVDVIREFKLDFDDAYQYVVAEKYRLTMVSLDSDFDRTALGRKTPAEVVEGRGGSST